MILILLEKKMFDQGTFTPVGAQGGGGRFPWNPPKKTTFPPEFCNEICTIYVYALSKTIIPEKNVVPFQNGGQKITDFYFASFRFWPKFEKPLSQRNFSMKFKAQSRENVNRFTLLK